MEMFEPKRGWHQIVLKLHTLCTFIYQNMFDFFDKTFTLFVFHTPYFVLLYVIHLYVCFHYSIAFYAKRTRDFLPQNILLMEENGISLFGITFMNDTLIYSIHSISPLPLSFSQFFVFFFLFLSSFSILLNWFRKLNAWFETFSIYKSLMNLNLIWRWRSI